MTVVCQKRLVKDWKSYPSQIDVRHAVPCSSLLNQEEGRLGKTRMYFCSFLISNHTEVSLFTSQLHCLENTEVPLQDSWWVMTSTKAAIVGRNVTSLVGFHAGMRSWRPFNTLKHQTENIFPRFRNLCAGKTHFILIHEEIYKLLSITVLVDMFYFLFFFRR